MRLEELNDSHAESFLAAMATFAAGEGLIFPNAKPWTQFEFKKQVKQSERERLDWRPGPDKISVTRYLMIGARGEVLAFGQMIFPLDEVGETDGGNLICEVPPPYRGQGWGSVCLSLLLFEAVRAGMRRVLVTCGAEDQAARRVIEKNRGVFLDLNASKRSEREGAQIARYWITFR